MKTLLRLLLMLGVGALLAGGIYISLWQIAAGRRPPQSPARLSIREGITYERFVWKHPRPIIWHVVRIDLNRYEIFSNPMQGKGELDLSAATTSQFAQKNQAILAVNGSFFEPFYMHHYFDFYPRVGDSINVMGRWMTEARLLSKDYDTFPVLAYNGDKAGCYDQTIPLGQIVYIPGSPWLLKAGELAAEFTEEPIHGRTCVGVNQAGTELWFVLVDGKQKNYSEGVTIYELASFLKYLGVYDGIGLDGGGSTTLVVSDTSGSYRVWNAPFHTHSLLSS